MGWGLQSNFRVKPNSCVVLCWGWGFGNCRKCKYVATCTTELKKHIETVHIDRGSYGCTHCDFTTTSDDDLKEHMQYHSNEDNQVPNDEILAENIKLKAELTALSDSYERLTAMYKVLKEEKRAGGNESKKELEEAQENLRVALTENEKLRETNNIQNNLCKIWMKEHNENEKETEIVVDEQLENNEEDLVTTFLQNRRRGFKRTSPSSPAEQKSKDSTHYVPNRNITNNSDSHRNIPNKSKSSGSTKRYCHFWNNSGNCTFRNCIFLHEKSPVCNFDGKCNRKKCMYSHMKQNRSFLAGNQRFHPSRTSWPRTPP